MSEPRLLVINPGGISTKVAVYLGAEQLRLESLHHEGPEFEAASGIAAQAAYRRDVIAKILASWGEKPEDFAATVARGGPFRPMVAGTYGVNDAMCACIREGRVITDHPSLVGALIAHEIAAPYGRPAFIVDPVCVDEMIPEARLSGLKDAPRVSLWHALNSRYAARVAAERRGLDYRKIKMVVAHLGSGISVSALRNGLAIDVSNANDMGPYAPQRAGGLPVTGLVELCFAPGATRESIRKRLLRAGGLLDYLGTSNFDVVRARIAAGDEEATLVVRGMAYQIAKEIGAMCAALCGADLIVLTGGLAHNPGFNELIMAHAGFLAPFEVCPGEYEMLALAEGARRVLKGEESALEYLP